MKRDKLWKAMGAIGWLLMLIGGCGMDSEKMAVPIVLLVSGLALCCLSARMTGEWKE